MAAISKIAHPIPSIHLLSVEIIWIIAAVLSPYDQASLVQTCHYMADVVGEVLWRDLDDFSPLLRLLPSTTAYPLVRGDVINADRLLLN